MRACIHRGTKEIGGTCNDINKGKEKLRSSNLRYRRDQNLGVD